MMQLEMYMETVSA